ncbi:Predicted PurR-regulated permease PerM [Tranquillimonas alkanivorans]|uniref:Predicted PurR-regulated permease PerM n=2 Tax=Tranquillimonas alkanivorans TaxID=441119 RepID=A0A1I5QDB1_9RHOB|nr:Predicted PurR-regulated permease PerM [Tranquillimonas alkanivorans]
MREWRLAPMTYGMALALMVGWLLWVGKPVLLPIISAIVALYILTAAAEALVKVPLLGGAPLWARRLLVLLAFTLSVALLFVLVITNFTRVAAALPGYEANLDRIVAGFADVFGFEDQPTWAALQAETFGRINTRQLITPLVQSIGGFGGTLFLIVLYVSFFVNERAHFARKLALAAGTPDKGARALEVLTRINERIGNYLLVKTLVNVVLGAASFVIMWLIGIEFALFWAVLIGFLNYIPYFGSMLGVLFPVLLSLAQFGSLGMAALSLVALAAAQIYVGGVLEPKLMGRAFNLSPLFVLLALAFWGALWGIPGAILAVPLTASLVIVLAEIPETRPAAIIMSANGRV